MISFDSTKDAFAYKTTEELKQANFLFSAMGQPLLLKASLALVPKAIRWHLPFTKTILHKTIFRQFVGGATLEETALVTNKLEKYNVKVILDYGVEGGKDGERGFDYSTDEFLKVINFAATQSNVPFMSVKVTGIVRFGLLELLDEKMRAADGTLISRYKTAMQAISEGEKQEWERVVSRLEKICSTAAQKKVGVLIDAEETWIQDPVDAITMLMMDHYNKGRVVVYNTLQLYRHDRLAFLIDSYQASVERNFVLGTKLVRGAYMENERKRAADMGYPSPIQPDKGSCDRDYDAAVKYCIQHIENIAVIVASHNEHSNALAAEMLHEKGLPHDHAHVHFSQLYGMSDHITFNLANAGYSVSKYLPFGPIEDVVPYLMRRAQENSAVAGQTGRELSLIKKELQRRKN